MARKTSVEAMLTIAGSSYLGAVAGAVVGIACMAMILLVMKEHVLSDDESPFWAWQPYFE